MIATHQCSAPRTRATSSGRPFHGFLPGANLARRYAARSAICRSLKLSPNAGIDMISSSSVLTCLARSAGAFSPFRIAWSTLSGRSLWRLLFSARLVSGVPSAWHALQAPSKKLIWFEDAAHMPDIEDPERFHQLLVEEVLPLAVGNRHP